MSETDDDTDEAGTESGSVPKSRSSTDPSIRRLRRPRRRRHELVRYTHILNSHIEDSLSPIDSFTLPKQTLPKHHPFTLQDSTILNTLWTTDEKNRFFTALARCGKGNLSEVARRVGTKSLVEVTAYVGVLDEETTNRKLSTLRPKRVYDYSKMPAAIEVDDQWIAFEDRMAAEIGRKTDNETTLEDTQDDEEMLLNIEKANELAIWYSPPILLANKGIKTLSSNQEPSVQDPSTQKTTPPSSPPKQPTPSTPTSKPSPHVSSAQSSSSLKLNTAPRPVPHKSRSPSPELQSTFLDFPVTLHGTLLRSRDDWMCMCGTQNDVARKLWI